MKKVKRVPVAFRYDAINPDFLKRLAMIGHYASEKYGSWAQYTNARLTGDKSAFNHIQEHLRAYQMNERYDHFDGDPSWHLVAVAYNAMIEFYYRMKWGALGSPARSQEEEAVSNAEKARRIVNCIIEDIKGRSGIGNEWEEIDEETRQEIALEWKDIVLGVLEK